MEDGLWELVAAGLVTADGFENLRALVDPKRRRGEGRGRSARPRHAGGRWALVAAPGAEQPRTSNEAFANQLAAALGRGVPRSAGARNAGAAWRDLLVALRRMEARGEIRGGRFVSGFVGEQFARPEALDLLRAIRRSQDRPEQICRIRRRSAESRRHHSSRPARQRAFRRYRRAGRIATNSPPPATESYNRASMRTILMTLAAAFSLAASDYKAGIGRIIITPEKPIYLSGYGEPQSPSEGVIHDLWAKALAIEDRKGARVVIVTTDLIGLPRGVPT